MAYVIPKVILLWLNFRKYGSSFIYSRKSCIQPMFHLKVKPRPPSSGAFVTPGHAVDSSAIIMAPVRCPVRTLFKWRKNSIASRFCSRRIYSEPSFHRCRNPGTASMQRHPREARRRGSFPPSRGHSRSGSFNLIFTVVKDLLPPVRMFSLSRVRVLVERLSVKVGKSMGVFRGSEPEPSPGSRRCPFYEGSLRST